MKAAAIIGAGVSGLTCGQLLKEKFDVTVFEANNKPGGLIRCEKVDGSLFHTCGGHVFNTRSERVLKWFWSKFNRDEQFLKAIRHSAICFDEGFVDYPIEDHIYQLPADIQKRIINDLLELFKSAGSSVSNFKDFLLAQFGQTLYDLYFQPYNRKIWRRDLQDVPLAWLEGKLPMPSIKEIIYANMNHIEERDFVHSTFYYEKEGGSQLIVDTLSRQLDIRVNEKIIELSYANNSWRVNGQSFDIVIYTGSLRDLPQLLRGLNIDGYNDRLSRLEYHGTTSVFCELEKNPYSWIYQPKPAHESHRIICTGNFSPSNNAAGKMTGTVEFTDEISKDEIIKQFEKMPFHPKYITHNFSHLTYPIQGKETRTFVGSLRKRLIESGLFLCGRFAEWEYYNMDRAIESAMQTADNVLIFSQK